MDANVDNSMEVKKNFRRPKSYLGLFLIGTEHITVTEGPITSIVGTAT